MESLLLDSDNTCLIHAINLCEVYYDFLRASDESTAQSAIGDLNTVGLITREDMDTMLWQEAGKIKAQGGVSLADCFALALAKRENAELLTSDHHEFDSIAENGVFHIKFFR